MDQQECLEKIVALEWPMFHTVNGEDRADCEGLRAALGACARGLAE